MMTDFRTEPPSDPDNWRFVATSDGAGWLPLSDADKAQRAIDEARAREVTPKHVKAECERRILELTGAKTVMESLVKQLNADGAYKPEIDRLRAKSNEIEALSPIPADYASDARWA